MNEPSLSIVGTWAMVEAWDIGDNPNDPTEKTYPWGNPPAGYWVYDSSGHFSLMISQNPALAIPADPFSGAPQPGWLNPTPPWTVPYDLLIATFATASPYAYFGTYTVEARRQRSPPGRHDPAQRLFGRPARLHRHGTKTEFPVRRTRLPERRRSGAIPQAPATADVRARPRGGAARPGVGQVCGAHRGYSFWQLRLPLRAGTSRGLRGLSEPWDSAHACAAPRAGPARARESSGRSRCSGRWSRSRSPAAHAAHPERA